MMDRSSHHNPDYDLSPQAERARTMRAYVARLEVIGEQMLQLIRGLEALLTE